MNLNEIIKHGKLYTNSHYESGYNEDFEFTLKYKKKDYDFRIDFHYEEGLSITDEHFTETFGSKISIDNICIWDEKGEEWDVLEESEMELMCEEKLLRYFEVKEFEIY
jgi:hypothetical protein